MSAATKRRIELRSSEDYLYDPERVQALHKLLAPDPDLFGDDPALALFLYLDGSLFGADVFDANREPDRWLEEDEVYDPEA